MKRLSWIIWWVLSEITCILIKRIQKEVRHIREKKAMNKVMNADSPQKMEEARNTFSPRASGEIHTLPTTCFGPRNTDSGFWPPEQQILLFQATQLVVICYSSHGKLIQVPSQYFIKNLWIFRNGFLMLNKWCDVCISQFLGWKPTFETYMPFMYPLLWQILTTVACSTFKNELTLSSLLLWSLT